MSAKFFSLVCCCSFLIAGCSPAIRKEIFLSTFAGEYKYDNLGWIETLTINSDRTYASVTRPTSEHVFTYTGKIYLENENTTFYRVVEEKIGTAKLRYIPVVWGDRKYLFYSLHDYVIDKFCDGVVDGTTIQAEDEGKLYDIFSHTENLGAPVFGEPEYINGEKFCQ